MASVQQVNFNSGNTYTVNPGSPTYVPAQATTNYRPTTTSTYGANNGQVPLRTTNTYVGPQYVNNSQFGTQGYVSTQQRQTNTQHYTTTTYDNRTTHQVNTYGQPTTTFNQPLVSATRSTNDFEEPKKNPIANICFGLLGLIALVSLILGILFAVGVIGNKGTDVSSNASVQVNSHFKMNHFEDQGLIGLAWNNEGNSQFTNVETEGSANLVREESQDGEDLSESVSDENENENGESEEQVSFEE